MLGDGGRGTCRQSTYNVRSRYRMRCFRSVLTFPEATCHSHTGTAVELQPGPLPIWISVIPMQLWMEDHVSRTTLKLSWASSNDPKWTKQYTRRTCCLQMLMINVRRARRYDCPATTKPEQMPDSGAYSLSLANAVNAHPSVGVPRCILSSLTRRTLREGRSSLNVVRGWCMQQHRRGPSAGNVDRPVTAYRPLQ